MTDKNRVTKHGEISSAVFDEIRRAEELHGAFPEDMIHAAAILAEESGELIQAAIDHTYSKPCLEQMKTEAVQTTAMGFRFLFNLADRGLI